MKHRTLRLHALAAGIGLSILVGCNGCKENNQSDRSSTGGMDAATTQPSTRAAAAMNARSADSLLAEAEHSEAKGDYDHALVVYQYLQSFPEASRPKDLDRRVDALKQKMQAPPQR